MDDSLRIIGEYGAYQTSIKIIFLGCAFLTNIYYNQIDIMLKFPNLKEKQINIKQKKIKIIYNILYKKYPTIKYNKQMTIIANAIIKPIR